MALMREKSISNEEVDFGALNGPRFSLYFSRLGNTLDRLSCNSDAPSSGNKLTSHFLLTIGFWPSDICTPPRFTPCQHNLLAFSLKVFSGTIWLPHILHNYPSTIRITTINNTNANNAITTRVYQIVKFLAGNIWVKLCWYQNLILTPILEAYIPQSGRSS